MCRSMSAESEEGDLAHHWSPSGFVPADGAVIEGHVKVAVVRLLRFRPKLGANAMHAHGLCPGDLAHDVDVVNAAVDDRDERVDEVLVPGPRLAVALLVEIEPHHKRLSQRLAEFNELHPAWMDPQDISEHQLPVFPSRGLDDLLRILDRHCDRLFHEDMRARIHGLDRIFCVRIRPSVDGDRVRL